ncbi:MAG: nitroreductase family protein [Beijerinckiaceae bacterium]|nr:nitroreductase family protein [Beijerinckiaceae bacterium]
MDGKIDATALDALTNALHDRYGSSARPGGESDAESLTPELLRILKRRTVRSYADREVPDALIGLLLAVAFSASSKSDFQQASVITIKDADKRAAIAKHFPAMPWIGRSPVFLVFCGDARRLERIGSLRGKPQTNRNLEGFLNASVDAALAMQTFILAAEASGLGCCPISVIRNQMPIVADILGLPDGVFAVSGLCVGYPDGKSYVSLRLPPSITLHTDVYDDAALPDVLDRYDAEREARNPTPREKQRSPERFGYAPTYGWSEDKARQAAVPEGAAFAEHILKTGFVFEG